MRCRCDAPPLHALTSTTCVRCGRARAIADIIKRAQKEQARILARRAYLARRIRRQLNNGAEHEEGSQE